MNGRVLSEEEIYNIEKNAYGGIPMGFTEVVHLIATIRDRDKTIAELLEQFEYVEEECRNLIWAFRPTEPYRERAQGNKDIVIQQNDILREALRSVRVVLGDFQEPWNPREREVDKIAREALAKVKD